MKASIASGVIIGLILLLVVANGFFVNHAVNTMKEMVDALPDAPGGEAVEQINAVGDYLDQKEIWLSFSVPFALLDRGVELCQTLASYAAEGSVYDYAATKASLADAIKDMGRLEKIDWKNIF